MKYKTNANFMNTLCICTYVLNETVIGSVGIVKQLIPIVLVTTTFGRQGRNDAVVSCLAIKIGYQYL